MDTLDLLQEALDEYQGTILIVSHDRDFLDKVTTSLLYMKGDGKINEYVGSYSDLLKEQKQIDTKKSSKTSVKSSIQPHLSESKQSSKNKGISNASPTQKRKLSFKQVHQLKMLPGEIEALEKEIQTMEKRIADPEFYQKDTAMFHETVNKLTQKRETLEQLENTWLELEILQEEINGR